MGEWEEWNASLKGSYTSARGNAPGTKEREGRKNGGMIVFGNI